MSIDIVYLFDNKKSLFTSLDLFLFEFFVFIIFVEVFVEIDTLWIFW